MAGQSKHLYLDVNEDKKRKIRLLFLYDKMAEFLRWKMHKILPEDVIQLYQALDKHRGYLKGLMRKGYISKQQFAILLPKNKCTNSSVFDITLTKTILFAEIICGYKRPGKGWKLMPHDHSDVANFIRIEMARNKIQHLGETVDQVIFDEIFDLVQPVLLDFNITQEKIDEMKNYGVDLQDIMYNLTIPVDNFIGREEKIQEIHDCLKAIEKSKKEYAVIIHGLPGVGKSETIRKYCHDYGDGKDYDNIIWINSESKELIENSFYDIAANLQIPTVDESNKKKPMKVIVDYVYSMLTVKKTDKSNSSALFVFDNVNDMQEVNEFLPSGQQKSPCIIATTQSQKWDHKRFKMIHLDVFKEDTADKFLQNELDTSTSKNDRFDLLSSLEHHPLALQQAVCYIIINEMSIQEYLRIYNSSDWSILVCEEMQNQIEGKSVFKTFSIAIKRLQDEEKESWELLILLAYLDGKQIEEELIIKMCSDDTLQKNRKLTILQNYSLINRNRRKEIGKDNTKIITVHSLVQRTVKSNVESKGETKKYMDILFQLIQEDFSDKKVLKERGKLMFHHFLHFFKEKNVKIFITEKWLCNNYYQNIFQIFEKFHQEKVFIELCTTLLNENKDLEKLRVLELKMFIAKSFLNIGQPNVAKKHFEDIMEFQSNNNLNETELPIAVQSNIGVCLQQMGKDKEALELYTGIVKSKQTQTMGFVYTNLILKHNIARCIQDMGKYKEALECYIDVESKQTQILEENDPNLLTTRRNIAQCFHKMGKHREALKLYTELESKKAQILGENHPSLLSTRNDIASCLKIMGKYKEALDLYTEIESKETQILGENHPSLLNTRQNIASCLQYMGKYKEALKLHTEIESKETQILGENHPSLLTTRSNIAQCYQDMGKTKEALKLFIETESKQNELLGENHPSLLTTRENIANCLQYMGKYKEALKLHTEIESKQTQILGENHPSLLVTKHNIAQCFHEMGKHREALKLFIETESKQNELLGENHPDLLTTRDNIAQCFHKMGKHKKALELYTEIESKLTQILGENHPSLLITKHNIASCFQDMGKHKEALELYTELESKDAQILGENHPSLLTTRCNIARCYQDMGKTKEALKLFIETESKENELLGENHPSLLTTRDNIAQCFQTMGKHKEALKLYRKIKSKQTQMLGENHPDLLLTKNNIALCLRHVGRHKEALELYTEIERKQTEILVENHPDLLTTRHSIEKCLLIIEIMENTKKNRRCTRKHK